MNVKSLLFPAAVLAGLLTVSVAHAEAPAGSTGECKDGTYSEAAKKSGACAKHGGVKNWYAEKGASSAQPKTTATPAVAATNSAATTTTAAAAAKPTPTQAPVVAPPSKAPAKVTAMPTQAAPGGGAGKVWVNTSSKVYHCSSDEWYGKTKAGEYMSEADAKAQGAHAAHGKACG